MDIYCLMALSWRLGTQFDIFMTFNSGFKQLHFQNSVCFYLAHVHVVQFITVCGQNHVIPIEIKQTHFSFRRRKTRMMETLSDQDIKSLESLQQKN
jgi:hypothetical protein